MSINKMLVEMNELFDTVTDYRVDPDGVVMCGECAHVPTTYKYYFDGRLCEVEAD